MPYNAGRGKFKITLKDSGTPAPGTTLSRDMKKVLHSWFTRGAAGNRVTLRHAVDGPAPGADPAFATILPTPDLRAQKRCCFQLQSTGWPIVSPAGAYEEATQPGMACVVPLSKNQVLGLLGASHSPAHRHVLRPID